MACLVRKDRSVRLERHVVRVRGKRAVVVTGGKPLLVDVSAEHKGDCAFPSSVETWSTIALFERNGEMIAAAIVKYVLALFTVS